MAHNSEAIRLAEASDWVGLERLVEKAPELARARGDYGMLPIHWACTEKHVPLALLDKLLAAHPDGARTKNAAHYLPLHIAIRAKVHPQWLRRLLAVNPQAVHVDAPEELSVLELAEQVGLGKEAMKVLLDAFVEVSPEHDDGNGSDADEPSDHDGEDAHEEVNNNSSKTASPEKMYPDHSQYELFGSTLTMKKKRSSLSPPVHRHHRKGSEQYQLAPNQDEEEESDDHQDEDDGERRQQQMWPPLMHGISRLTSTDTSDAVGSPLLRSLSSLSDDGTMDSPHDRNLISPSSTSTSSRAHSTSSVNSAPLPLTAVPPLHKQMQGPFHRKHSLDYHRAAVAAAAARHHHQESLAMRSRNQPQSRSAVSAGQLGGGGRDQRHQSLPVVPSFENYKFAPMTLNPRHFSHNGGHHSHHDMYHDRSSEEDESEHARRRFHRNGSGGYRHDSGAADVDDDELERDVHGRHFESPPEWRRDDECAICRVSFGMFKHRHHCRNCGKSICSQHSADRKVSMTSKGFKTPQRVCVTCYADLTNQSRAKHEMSPFDAVLDAAGLGSSNNPVVAFAMQHMQTHQQQQQQQHYALGTQSLRSPQYASPLNKGTGSPTETFVSNNGSSASLHHSYNGHGTTSSALTKEKMETYMLHAQMSELRHLAAAQQKQIEQLVQNNIQMQQQVLEQEELKAETMLLMTQLMTRVSVLELQKNENPQQDGEEDDNVEGNDDNDNNSGAGY
ncbi:Membrane trafficking and cell signaling protein [Globisporangium polare]